jgi:hypothetical protein
MLIIGDEFEIRIAVWDSCKQSGIASVWNMAF